MENIAPVRSKKWQQEALRPRIFPFVDTVAFEAANLFHLADQNLEPKNYDGSLHPEQEGASQESVRYILRSRQSLKLKRVFSGRRNDVSRRGIMLRLLLRLFRTFFGLRQRVLHACGDLRNHGCLPSRGRISGAAPARNPDGVNYETFFCR